MANRPTSPLPHLAHRAGLDSAHGHVVTNGRLPVHCAWTSIFLYIGPGDVDVVKRVVLAMLVIVLVELVHVAVLLRLAQRAGSQERLHTTLATTARAHHVALELLQPPPPIRPQKKQCVSASVGA